MGRHDVDIDVPELSEIASVPGSLPGAIKVDVNAHLREVEMDDIAI